METTLTVSITREGILDSLMVAWLLFTAAFTYIGVTHLETISRCLVIQTEIMVSGQPGGIVIDPPPHDPQASADGNTVA